MAGYIGQGKVQFLDNNGRPLVGGQVWVYIAQSNTLTNTYNDFINAINGINPQANPVPLDSRGEAIIIINNTVKLVVEDANISPSTGHGNLIWTVDNFAIATAEEFNVGEYHFQGNTVADADNSPAFSFNAITNGLRFVQLNAAATGNSPEIIAVSNSGVDNVDLHVRPQNTGTVVAYSALKVLNTATNPNFLNIATSSGIGAPIVLTAGGIAADVGLTITAQGAGVVNVTSPLTTVDITSSTAVKSPSFVGTNSGFTYTITPGTLTANKTMVLPSNTQIAKQAIITDGSSVLTYGYPSRPSVCYVQLVTPIACLHGATTALAMDTVICDPTTAWNTSTKRWTPGVVGYWRVSLVMVGNNLNGGFGAFSSQIFKNGVFLYYGAQISNINGVALSTLTSEWIIYNTVITDYYEFKESYTNSTSVAAQLGGTGSGFTASFLHE